MFSPRSSAKYCVLVVHSDGSQIIVVAESSSPAHAAFFSGRKWQQTDFHGFPIGVVQFPPTI